MKCDHCGYEGSEPEAFTYNGDVCMACVYGGIEERAMEKAAAICEAYTKDHPNVSVVPRLLAKFIRGDAKPALVDKHTRKAMGLDQ
jgi:Na+-translocating ferredoxin:NAD+ oxidoreductase RNF subunit RnfB